MDSKSIFAYFTNWSIYGRGYNPKMIPVDNLTNINYAFLNLKEDGHLALTDPWADEQIWTDWQKAPGDLYGCLGSLFELKKNNRHLKTGFSVGGWTLSKYVSPVLASPEKRSILIKDCVDFTLKYGCDYIDLDFEWLGEPANDGHLFSSSDGPNFTKFIIELHEKLREIPGNSDNKKHYITMAAACGPDKYRHYEMNKIEPYISKVLLMAYDFSGGWSSETDHHANLYKGDTKTGFSIDQAVKAYINGGFPSNKIVIGAPLYSRSFSGVKMGHDQDGYQQVFTGLPPGSYEKGVYDYKDIVATSTPDWNDEDSVAAFRYNPSEGVWHSYDNVASLKKKLDYINENNLGGIMFWELSGDTIKGSDNSLIKVSADAFSGHLDRSINNLSYPTSTWNNLKALPPGLEAEPVPEASPPPVVPPHQNSISHTSSIPVKLECNCPFTSAIFGGAKRKRTTFEGKCKYNNDTKKIVVDGTIIFEY